MSDGVTVDLTIFRHLEKKLCWKMTTMRMDSHHTGRLLFENQTGEKKSLRVDRCRKKLLTGRKNQKQNSHLLTIRMKMENRTSGTTTSIKIDFGQQEEAFNRIIAELNASLKKIASPSFSNPKKKPLPPLTTGFLCNYYGLDTGIQAKPVIDDTTKTRGLSRKFSDRSQRFPISTSDLDFAQIKATHNLPEEQIPEIPEFTVQSEFPSSSNKSPENLLSQEALQKIAEQTTMTMTPIQSNQTTSDKNRAVKMLIDGEHLVEKGIKKSILINSTIIRSEVAGSYIKNCTIENSVIIDSKVE